MTTQTSVKQRLFEFLKFKNIGQKAFARSIGMSDGYVNAIRVSIQPGTLHKIAMQYPDLNTGWLMTGEGEMLRDVKPEPTASPSTHREDRLLALIEGQQRTIESQQRTIEELSKKIRID